MQSPGLPNFAKFSRIFKISERFLASNGYIDISSNIHIVKIYLTPGSVRKRYFLWHLSSDRAILSLYRVVAFAESLGQTKSGSKEPGYDD